jgi:hypothetical protein
MEEIVLGEFRGSTLIYEEILFGGIEIRCFFGVYPGFHVEGVRRGVPFVFPPCCLGELL